MSKRWAIKFDKAQSQIPNIENVQHRGSWKRVWDLRENRRRVGRSVRAKPSGTFFRFLFLSSDFTLLILCRDISTSIAVAFFLTVWGGLRWLLHFPYQETWNWHNVYLYYSSSFESMKFIKNQQLKKFAVWDKLHIITKVQVQYPL